MAAELPKPETKLVSFRQIAEAESVWFPTIEEALSLAKPSTWGEKERKAALEGCTKKIRCFGKDMPTFTQTLVIALHNAISIWKDADAKKPNPKQVEAICNILNKEIKPVVLDPESFKNSKSLAEFLGTITGFGETQLKKSFEDNATAVAKLEQAEKVIADLEKKSTPDKPNPGLNDAIDKRDAIMAQQRLSASLGQAAGNLLSILSFAGHAHAATVAGDAFEKEIEKKEAELQKLGYTYDSQHNTWTKEKKTAEKEKTPEKADAIVEAEPAGQTIPQTAPEEGKELATQEMIKAQEEEKAKMLFREVHGLQLMRIRSYMTGYLGIQGEQLNAVRAAHAFLKLDPKYLMAPQTQPMRAAFGNIIEGIAISIVSPDGIGAAKIELDEYSRRALFHADDWELALLAQKRFPVDQSLALETRYDDTVMSLVTTKDARARTAVLQQQASTPALSGSTEDDTRLAVRPK